MKWLDEKVSFYNNHADNIGRNDFTFRDIFLTKFGVPHDVYGKECNDLETIIALGKLDRSLPDFELRKAKLKGTLQAFTPAALLVTREKGKVVEIARTAIAQIDCDGKDNPGVDMGKLKIDLFNTYHFIAFAGMSASGDGFYLLVAIADPDKLVQYMEQLFWFFKKCNIVVDTSKGRNVHDLRYISYDSKMLIREDPEPLKISNFIKEREAAQESKTDVNRQIVSDPDKIAEHWLKKLRACQIGERWQTVCDVARALGSKRKSEYKLLIQHEINSNSIFKDEREKFLKATDDCFQWGWNYQLHVDIQAR